MMNTAIQSAIPLPSYAELTDEIRFLRHENQNLIAEKNYLEEIIRHLKRLRFAPSSEIYPKGQQTLFNEAEYLAAPGVEAGESTEESSKPTKSKKKRGRPVRSPLPESLPRVEDVVDLAEADKICPKTGAPLVKIGEEVSEQLDIKPTEAFVIKTIRIKYGCNCSECNAGETAPTMKTAPVEAQPIPKSMASPGLLANIVVSKYDDAMPLARQEKMFGRSGIELHRGTMANWIMILGELVIPLINLVREALIRSLVIQADETRIQVRKGTGKSPISESYMWVFKNEDRGGSKIVLYELGPSRAHTVPLRVLEGFSGYLHTDGLEAYETLAAKMPSITLVGDWAHVRRKFDEAVKAVPKDFKGEIKAETGLKLINELFRIEREDMAKDATLEERLKIRREKSAPIIDELKTWADETLPTIPPKTLSGKALHYMLERWPKLTIFLQEPILRLDTNPVEGAIRPFVVGRNNWMFADTLKGAEASAALYSLTSMARLANHNPFVYFKDIFTRLPKAKLIEDIECLLPWNWKPPV